MRNQKTITTAIEYFIHGLQPPAAIAIHEVRMFRM